MANDEQTSSEEQKGSPEQQETEQKQRSQLSNHRRFPILLRVLVVLVLAIAMLALGAIIGYSVIGGGDWKDVFDIETWRHITDFWLTS